MQARLADKTVFQICLSKNKFIFKNLLKRSKNILFINNLNKIMKVCFFNFHFNDYNHYNQATIDLDHYAEDQTEIYALQLQK